MLPIPAPRPWLLAAVLLVGCPPPATDPPADTTGGESISMSASNTSTPSSGDAAGTSVTDSAPGETTADPDDTTAGLETTAGLDTTTTDVDTTTDGDTTTAVDPSPSCEDPAPDLDAHASIVFDPWPEVVNDEQPFLGDCTVIEVAADAKFLITLDCGDRLATIEGEVDPAEFTLDLVPGQVLELHFLARAGAFWSNTWFTLRDAAADSPLLLGVINADAVTPVGAPDFFAPIAVDFDGADCGPATDCDDPFDRLIVAFSHAGEAVELPDATRAGFGDYRALLSFAGRFRDLHDMSPECKHWTDWVPESFVALIFRQPG